MKSDNIPIATSKQVGTPVTPRGSLEHEGTEEHTIVICLHYCL